MTDAAVCGAQIRALYSQSVPILFANAANALIVSVVLWRPGLRAALGTWTVAVLLVTAARIRERRSYWEAAPGPEESRPWGLRFVIGSAAAGLLWGAAGVLFFDADGMLSRLLLTFSIGGMCAGAAGTLAGHRPAFWAFLISALLPLTLWTLSFADSLHVALGAMMTVYALSLSIIARTTHRSLTEAFRLRFENDALLGGLTLARRTLEETNRNLEQRVAERTEELEQQTAALREAQRMEAIGRLAGGIAHDFNNILTVVQANADLLARGTQLDDEARSAVEDVRNVAGRGADLVRQLLAFSRRQRRNPEILDLNELVRHAERLLARLIGDSVTMQVTPCAEPAWVRADRSQLEQVIVNLATNARDAMPGGGVLSISTSVVRLEGETSLAPRTYTVLTVRDTGVGMDAETRRHAFDPFFTTKELGKGTGLGLATVYGVIEQSGGHVLLDTRVGAGSCFDIYLPAVGEPERRREQEILAAPVARVPAGVTVLVAEDDPEVRSVTGRMLSLAGYDVILAADGKEALARSQQLGAPIELLITDVVMGGLGGVELAHALREQRPGLRVLFVTGHSFDRELPGSDPLAGIDYLEKPFTYQDLTRKVATLLLAAEPGTPQPIDPEN